MCIVPAPVVMSRTQQRSQEPLGPGCRADNCGLLSIEGTLKVLVDGGGRIAMLDSERSAGFSDAFEGNTPGLVVKVANI